MTDFAGTTLAQYQARKTIEANNAPQPSATDSTTITQDNIPAASSSAGGNSMFMRKASLLLVSGDHALDLSQMHFKFTTAQQDEESPDSCSIRVYNLSAATVKQIKGEYSKVVLQAGYQGDGQFGVIFQGTIRQYRQGKDGDNITTFLDILAADGDIAYNFATVNTTLASGATVQQKMNAMVAPFAAKGVTAGQIQLPQGTGGVLPRGKVLFGLARGHLRAQVQSLGSTWNISNGAINVTPLTGYVPGEAVVLTAQSGLIGRVEQTEDGMRCRCLINPKIQVGGLVKIDNASINTTSAAAGSQIPGAQLAYNKYAGIQQFADTSADGLYRVYVAEYDGDTRGQNWYLDLTCLSIDPVTMQCKAYG